jgi:hypothetical protein
VSSVANSVDLGLALLRLSRHDRMMDYEYAPLRIPPNVDRLTATAQLAIQAEYSGWELARVQLYRDGTRQVVMRRRIAPGQPRPQPGLSI